MRFARAGQCSMVGGEGRSSCRTQIRRFRFMADTPVASELVGAVWPAAHPGEDPLLYGHVELQPKGAFEARSVQTFRSEEHTSELQSLMRISYAVFCLKKKKNSTTRVTTHTLQLQMLSISLDI